MGTMPDDLVVEDHPELARYELRIAGVVAGVADYAVHTDAAGEVLVLPHTEIDPAHRGQGLGVVLVRGVLDDARRRGRRVVPQCWFVREFIGEHVDYADLVAP